MILVDTNVWSELMRPIPDARVQNWEAANAARLWLATVVLGELLSGVQMMPPGRRRDRFLAGYEVIIEAHVDRIVAFDLAAARRYAGLLALMERQGRNPDTADVQIAAMALSRGMALATRNTKHFAGLDIALIDPWQE